MDFCGLRRGGSFWKMIRFTEGETGMQAEITQRSIDEKRLLVQSEFWPAHCCEFGNYVELIWKTEGNDEREGVMLKIENGEIFLGTGWLTFMRKHKLKQDDLLLFRFVGKSTFYVRKLCRGWMSESEEDEDDMEPIHILDSDDGTDLDEPTMHTIERRSERKKPAIQLPNGYHFGCAYPLFRSKNNELGFSLDKEATVLRGMRGSKEWEIQSAQTGTIWNVTLRVYPDSNRAIFCRGWKRLRDKLDIMTADIVAFKVMDKEANPPTMLIHHLKVHRP